MYIIGLQSSIRRLSYSFAFNYPTLHCLPCSTRSATHIHSAPSRKDPSSQRINLFLTSQISVSYTVRSLTSPTLTPSFKSHKPLTDQVQDKMGLRPRNRILVILYLTIRGFGGVVWVSLK